MRRRWMPVCLLALILTLAACSQVRWPAATDPFRPEAAVPTASQSLQTQPTAPPETMPGQTTAPAEPTVPPEPTAPPQTQPVSTQPPQTQPLPTEPPTTPAQTHIVRGDLCVTEALLEDYVNRLCEKYPSLLRQGVYGTSVMGRPLRYLTLGTGSREVCAVAGMHAWEHINTLYLLRCAEDYAESVARGDGSFGPYDMGRLLSEYTIYLVPNCNPDGSETCITGAPMRFSEHPSRQDLKSNANGVDLNRNFPIVWDEADTGVYQPSEAFYKGPTAASEPETQALMALCAAHDFEFLFSFHIQGKVIYWVDATTGEVPGARRLCDAVAARCGLTPAGVSTNKGGYGGGFENWFRLAYNRPGFCLELVAAFQPVPFTSQSFGDALALLEYEKTRFALPEALQTLLEPS